MTGNTPIGWCRLGDLVVYGNGLGIIVRVGGKFADHKIKDTPVYHTWTHWFYPATSGRLQHVDRHSLSHLRVELVAR